MIYDRTARAVEPVMIGVGCIAAGALAIYWADRMRSLRPVLAAFVLIALTAVDVAWNNGPSGASAIDPRAVEILEPGSRNQTLAYVRGLLAQPASKERRDRVEFIGLGFHWPNASLTHSIEQTLGYNPVRLKLYADGTGAGDSSGGWDQRKFSKLMPSYKSPIADLLGLRYIVSGVPIEKIDPSLKPDDFKLLAKTPDGSIYENPRALPRVLFATNAVGADFAKLMAEGGMPGLDYRTTVLLDSAAADSRERRPGSARIIRYTNTEIEIEADSPDGGWVVLNDIWHPWWQASIDGIQVPLMRANVLFRAVAVPAGKIKLRFSFAPFAGVRRVLYEPTLVVH